MAECCDGATATKANPDHSELIPRLNRIRGQVDGVIKMVEDRRYCVEILSQVTAIQSALRACEANLLERHLVSCLQGSITNGSPEDAERKVKEMVTFFKKRMK